MSDEQNNSGGGDEEATVFTPAARPGAGTAVGGGATAYPTSATFAGNFAPREVGEGIKVGDVLNHIFEVRRFLARGGMGEVFEGININTDERVAIKVMLPQLAADPNVIGMFRKEARTLTRLNHEGLVAYRVLAQEPQLGVLYIVTEFIDGVNLADALGKEQPTAADLALLLRRLASGLRVAHQLGAIHRDISPDNVLLEDGELGKAKVIDFGIAKDLDPGSKTIVGEGFAGKLNYVAPEQLGDFGRDVGPWTDVYSLALVILAVALGKNVQMGGSLVDAVDKRRAGPDISAIPEEIRPIIAKMLAPNPADRLRSMDEVLAELEPKIALVAPEQIKSKTPLFIGGGVAAAALAVAAYFAFTSGPAISSDPIEGTRQVVNASLPSVGCTWLDVIKVEQAGGQVAVALTGVAGNPKAAQDEIGKALAAQKITNATLNFDAVAPITQSGCAALDAYRQIRGTDAQRLKTAKPIWQMTMQPNDPKLTGYPGKVAANVPLQISVGEPSRDIAIIGIEPSGVIDAEFLGPGSGVLGRSQLQSIAQSNPDIVSAKGKEAYQMRLDVDHEGWSGVLMLSGKGPFDQALIAPGLGARGPDWLNKFVSTAAEHGWQSDMVWFKTVER